MTPVFQQRSQARRVYRNGKLERASCVRGKGTLLLYRVFEHCDPRHFISHFMTWRNYRRDLFFFRLLKFIFRDDFLTRNRKLRIKKRYYATIKCCGILIVDGNFFIILILISWIMSYWFLTRLYSWINSWIIRNIL